MLTTLRIWSAFVAVALATVETLLNVVVYEGKPLSILLPDYVIAAWLLAGAFFPRWGGRLLVSAWAVALGNYYGVFVENLAFHEPPTFFLTALGLSAVLAAICLGLAIRYAGPGPSAAHEPEQQGNRSLSTFLKVYGTLFAVLVVCGQRFTSWGQEKPMSLIAPYYLISGAIALAVLLPRRVPHLSLAVWSVALGFFYLEFSGFLVFFERSPWVVRLAGGSTLAAFVGMVLQSALTLRDTGGGLSPPGAAPQSDPRPA